jgi:hypothetical protein
MSNENQTQAYGIFWRRSSGYPNAAKLLNDRLYWDFEDAFMAWQRIEHRQQLDVRSVIVSVGDVVDCDHHTSM